MVIGELELKKLVQGAIRKTIYKFRRYPNLFFTESDIHSYFYGCLYGRKLEVKTRDGILTSCLHREYPTNFRFNKKSMIDYGLERKGGRGHYDMTILNPQFIQDNDIKNVINKDVRDLEYRVNNNDKFKNEIISAIEFKYVINNSKSFITEFKKDVIKLSLGRRYQDFEAYSLVFCNHEYRRYFDELKDEVEKSTSKVFSRFVRSYYEGSKKISKIFTNQGIDFL